VLRFDHDRHDYYWLDRPMPSVTGVLKRSGYGVDLSFVDPERLEAARVRGCTVHDYIECYYSNVEIPDHRESPYRGYIESFLRWDEVARLDPWMVEHQVCSLRLWVAGRLDVNGELRGFGYHGTIDFKSRPPHRDDFLQDGGYQILAAETIKREQLDVNASDVLSGKRVVVGLRADGKMAKQIISTNPLDLVLFERAASQRWGIQ
jgi:hypothetical protein